MFQEWITASVVLSICLINLGFGAVPNPDLPDLKIVRYEFVSTNEKSVRVLVANIGKASSKPCLLELGVRKIKGVGATRNATETIPGIEAGKEEWVIVNTSGILQSALSLKEDTSFRLRADETNVVSESNEDNNDLWHNEN